MTDMSTLHERLAAADPLRAMPPDVHQDLARRQSILNRVLAEAPSVRPGRRTGLHGPRRRLAFGAAALAVAVGVGALFTVGPLGADRSDTLAFHGGEVPPEVRAAADRCIEDNNGLRQRLGPSGPGPAPSLENLRLVNFLRQHGRVQVIYVSDTTIAYCTNSSEEQERSAGYQPIDPWLRGPISVESESSSEYGGGGEVLDIAGRASARVGRIVLDHGNGRTTEANLVDGTFIINNDGPVKVGHGTLVTYDRAGNVIDRRPAGRSGDPDRSCYTDPTGAVVLSAVAEPALDRPCQPAESWR
ncbi:hypothetical protein [Virgisporangium aurantiacum]|uniref:Uncharacterized protein n=1 Tax=Virgisporangium aurantiacum TaxID=175570 RepID=A0A8J4E766_9ACTN|nr:hypothetical protein [Virgisporangium aurantiacum]GIJ63868.1 hypothetical protein Vau01_113840 [Virgisporangium aurantiacum]